MEENPPARDEIPPPEPAATKSETAPGNGPARALVQKPGATAEEPFEPELLDDEFSRQVVKSPTDETEKPAVREHSAQAARPAPRRRVLLPLLLLGASCVTVFLAGAGDWYFLDEFSLMALRRAIISNFHQAIVYTLCLIAILGAHEMGHFLATVRYRIPATFPFFLPMPNMIVGTLGAVIAMDGLRANRKELFDIGIAGPLAGLVIAVPVLIIGILKLDLTAAHAQGAYALDTPLLVKWMLHWLRPEDAHAGMVVWRNQLNGFYMAGWVGLLITGLNMMPVSQLDGGHVVYTLFPRRAHMIARGFLMAAIALIVFLEIHLWTVMILLVIFMGTDHPPTSNDDVELGPIRTTIGYASLSIAILCFPAYGIIQ